MRLLKLVGLGGAALTLGGLTAVAQQALTPPPAGAYRCRTSRMDFSPIQGPGGPMMIIHYDPSALGTLQLDGKGGYRTAKSSGRYSFNRATGAFSFTSGGMAGWPVRYEVVRGAPTVRLAPSQKEKVSEKSRTGEHVCTCNPAAPAKGGRSR